MENIFALDEFFRFNYQLNDSIEIYSFRPEIYNIIKIINVDKLVIYIEELHNTGKLISSMYHIIKFNNIHMLIMYYADAFKYAYHLYIPFYYINHQTIKNIVFVEILNKKTNQDNETIVYGDISTCYRGYWLIHLDNILNMKKEGQLIIIKDFRSALIFLLSFRRKHNAPFLIELFDIMEEDYNLSNSIM